MSVLLALAIIVAIIAVAIRRNNNVKAAAVVATTEVVAANVAAPSAAHTQDVCDPINDCNAVDYSVMVALVYILMYTKIALKAQRLEARRARSANAAMYRSNGLYIARGIRSAMMEHVTYINAKAVAKADERKALVRSHNAPSATYAQLGACGIKAAKRAALGIKCAVHRRAVPVVHTHVCAPAVVRTIKRVPSVKAANAAPRGKDLAAAAQSVHGNLIARIHAAKATLNSMYSILPLARQVVALQNKADRKVGMYNWLSDEGHVGLRSTKASIDRRDAAQEVVCKATLAAEAFKEAYGIEAQDVVSQILAVKAAKARAVEMLRNHKAEQHRLFLERQERRAAKAALRASKAAPVAAPVVTEVADWEKYAPVNSGNKAMAFGILHATSATVAQKAAAIAAINGVSQQNHNLAGKCTADAAYVVAA